LDLEWETTGAGVGDHESGRVRGDVLLGRDTIPVDTPGPFTHSVADVGFGDRTIVAWDDGSWSYDATHVDVFSRAVVPVDDGVVPRALGAAATGARRGTAWIESFRGARERIG